MLTEYLAGLSPSARRGLAAGLLVMILAIAGSGTWLLRPDYQVLFTDLKPQDAAAMAAELERQKVPFRLSDDGSTLYVDNSIVHATRMKLMGKEIPLHGAAGFELFNGGDFGMTEFAQKVNYQRALQGEITRTILSLAEVREARVHLALPEEGLFKRAGSRPKAAITLGLKPGQSLRPDQVSGIQKLVAGAVAGISPQDVTIVDQQGIALTRAAAAESEPEAGGGRLDFKRETERLLARKATDVLERAFGTGQAMATVDVTLNMDQVRVTTEDVVGVPAAAGAPATGVIVREREVVRDAMVPVGSPPDAAGRSGNSQREVDYQVGRRVEQVVTQPGAVRRLHVAAVVRMRLESQQLEQARELVSAAVGGIPERGDTIVVQSLASYALAISPDVPAARVAPVGPPPQPAIEHAAWMPSPGIVLAGALLALTAMAVGGLHAARRRAQARNSAPVSLQPAEREALVKQLRLWLEQGRADARLAARSTSSLPDSDT